MSWQEWISGGPVLTDGAWGTDLQVAGALNYRTSAAQFASLVPTLREAGAGFIGAVAAPIRSSSGRPGQPSAGVPGNSPKRLQITVLPSRARKFPGC